PADLWAAQHRAPDASSGDAFSPTAGADGGGDGPLSLGPQFCSQAQAQSIPARLVAMSASAPSAGSVVLVSDIFQRFVANGVCGGCQGPSVDPPGEGGFQIRSANDFLPAMTPAVLAHVISDISCPFTPDPTNPKEPMP